MAYDDIVSSMVLELRRGTLVMLVLSQLREPAYGYALVKSLADHGIPIEAKHVVPADAAPRVARAAGKRMGQRRLEAAQILPHHRRGPARAARSGGPVARSVRRGVGKLLETNGEDREHAER
mgnify:CR=1 FL=1